MHPFTPEDCLLYFVPLQLRAGNCKAGNHQTNHTAMIQICHCLHYLCRHPVCDQLTTLDCSRNTNLSSNLNAHCGHVCAMTDLSIVFMYYDSE